MGLFDMAKNFHPDSKIFGFLEGPHGVYSNEVMEISSDYMDKYRNLKVLIWLERVDIKLNLKNNSKILLNTAQS